MARGTAKRRIARRGTVHVREVPHSALVAGVAAELEPHGLSMSKFIELGRAGRLDSDELRDLWLMAGPALP